MCPAALSLFSLHQDHLQSSLGFHDLDIVEESQGPTFGFAVLPGLKQTQADPRAVAHLGVSCPVWRPWTYPSVRPGAPVLAVW